MLFASVKGGNYHKSRSSLKTSWQSHFFGSFHESRFFFEDAVRKLENVFEMLCNYTKYFDENNNKKKKIEKLKMIV